MKPCKRYKWTPVEAQIQIITERLSGAPLNEVAAKYGLHATTVSRICTRIRRLEPDLNGDQRLKDWKAELKAKAIEAVRAGLDDPSDPLKRAQLGIKVLDALGWPPEASQ